MATADLPILCTYVYYEYHYTRIPSDSTVLHLGLCEEWLVNGGVWERVSASFAQHSREDAWRAL